MQAASPYESSPQTPSANPGGSSRTLHIKQIDVLSAGKLLGCFYALLGLIIGGFFSLLAILGAGVGGGEAVAGLVLGVGAIVVIPIFYGVLGFIGGMIGALVYNAVAAMVGGIRIDVEF